MRFWSILGNSQRLDGGAMFGNAPRALWQRWAPPDELGRIELACRALLIDDGDKRVLCETGVGAFFPPAMRDRYGVVESRHMLIDNLNAAGWPHDTIDVVVLSHLHFDHAGGLLTAYREDAELELLFPNARFVVGRRAWERNCAPHARDRASFIPELTDLLVQSGRLELCDDAAHPLLGERYRFHYSDGHTPGLALLEISTDDGPVLFAADLIPGKAWIHLPITMGYDRFPERLIDEKENLLTDLLERGGSVFFTHDPSIALGRVAQDQRGRFTVEAARGDADLQGLTI